MPGMEAHFRAFSLVDRITRLEAGGRVEGRYHVPEHLAAFPASLVAEAVGQLAAWAAMAVLAFRRRPVAGLAAGIDLLAPVRPGQTLELAAELESLDEEAVAYSGVALVNARPVVRLEHCVGPVLPVEDFDDPAALRQRLALLQADGARPGGFDGVPAPDLTGWDGEAGRVRRAMLHVPTEAVFFADHFPRRPVYPGTLLMHANLEVAAALTRELPRPVGGQGWTARRVSDVKLRAFTPPGEVLELQAAVEKLDAQAADTLVETRKGTRVISRARVRFVPEAGA